MSNAAYIPTKHVRHLAAWTADKEQGTYRTGAYRPLCGERVRTPLDVVWATSQLEDPDVIARAKRKPVCRYCLKALAALNDIAN